MNTLNLEQTNSNGENHININLSQESSLSETIRKSLSKKPNEITLRFKENNKEGIQKHVNRNTIVRNINISENNDVDIQRYYIPLSITTDIEALKKIEKERSLSEVKNELKKKFEYKENYPDSQENIYSSAVDQAFLQFQAESQRPYRISENENIDSNKNITIDSDFIIEDYFKAIRNNIICIQAGAGYGKTTILRKILLNQHEKGLKTPIFVSLKIIKTSLIKLILEAFQEINLHLELVDVIHLLKNEQFILILDSFDEINEKEIDKNSILNEIYKISTTLNTKILLSSRPSSTINIASGITIFGIRELHNTQLKQLLLKLNINNHFDSSLIDEFLKNPARKAVRTPLLANLFIRTYPYLNAFPESSRDFYKNIFDLLYSGHDTHKGPERIYRKFRDLISLEKSKEIWSLFCLITLITDYDHKTSTEFSRILKNISQNLKINPPNNYHQDDFYKDFIESLIDCTSLLVEDGKYAYESTYTHIHKSIQEFYAASFFKSSLYDQSEIIVNRNVVSKINESIIKREDKFIELLQHLSYLSKSLYKQIFINPILEQFNINKDFFSSSSNLSSFARVLFEKSMFYSKEEVRLLSSTKNVREYGSGAFIEVQNLSPYSNAIIAVFYHYFNEENSQDIFENLLDDLIETCAQELLTPIPPDDKNLKKITLTNPLIREKTIKIEKNKNLNLIITNEKILKKLKEFILFLSDIKSSDHENEKDIDFDLATLIE